MALNNLKKRLDLLESQQPQPRTESVMARIAEYESIIERGDYSSPEGKRLKATIEKYALAIQKIEEE